MDDGLEILSDEECRALLHQANLGRVAITIGALPAVLPVNYTLLEGDIVFLTGEGVKLRAALDRTVVAFEVDAIDGFRRAGWSVLAVGIAEEITEEDELARARDLDLRPLAGGSRTHFVRVRPDFLSGRRITGPNGAGGGEAASGHELAGYRPPLGRLGAMADTVAGGDVVLDSVEGSSDDVVTRIETEVAPKEGAS